jgi:hypothetical protein
VRPLRRGESRPLFTAPLVATGGEGLFLEPSTSSNILTARL